MKKKNSNRLVIPTKFLPRGARRITNKDGDRVWLINGMEFASKAEYWQWRNDKILAEKARVAAPAVEETPATPEPVAE